MSAARTPVVLRQRNTKCLGHIYYCISRWLSFITIYSVFIRFTHILQISTRTLITAADGIRVPRQTILLSLSSMIDDERNQTANTAIAALRLIVTYQLIHFKSTLKTNDLANNLVGNS